MERLKRHNVRTEMPGEGQPTFFVLAKGAVQDAVYEFFRIIVVIYGRVTLNEGHIIQWQTLVSPLPANTGLR